MELDRLFTEDGFSLRYFMVNIGEHFDGFFMQKVAFKNKGEKYCLIIDGKEMTQYVPLNEFLNILYGIYNTLEAKNEYEKEYGKNEPD